MATSIAPRGPGQDAAWGRTASEFALLQAMQVVELGRLDAGLKSDLDQCGRFKERLCLRNGSPLREANDPVRIALVLQNVLTLLAGLFANRSRVIEYSFPGRVVPDGMNDQHVAHLNSC